MAASYQVVISSFVAYGLLIISACIYIKYVSSRNLPSNSNMQNNN